MVYRGKYQNKSSAGPRRKFGFAPIVAIAAIGIVIFLIIRLFEPKDDTSLKDPTPTVTDPAPSASVAATVSTTPTETEPCVVSTGTIGVTGDVLIHNTIFNSAWQSDGTYDFTPNYACVKDYFSRYDLMIANLEVTLGGTEAGGYSSYPMFNCPDSIVDALLDAGVDLLLTANNHTNDTAAHGIMRTQQVLTEKGMDYLGTRQTVEDPTYTLRDVNGIQVGMAVYTYETGKASGGRPSLNGLPLSSETAELVSTFSYDDLEGFYTEVESTLAAMEAEGAELSMVFLHWGDEYQTSPNENQKAIAQALCELGVDVIVGGHPHVIQPFETLTSSEGHTTYCIYSVGNAIADQPRSKISSAPNGHTEDGMIFQLGLEKWSDGSVKISEIDILPTWTDRTQDGIRQFRIIPIDYEAKSWSAMGISNSEAAESYQRTMQIVGEGLNQCREQLGLEPVPLSLTEE